MFQKIIFISEGFHGFLSRDRCRNVTKNLALFYLIYKQKEKCVFVNYSLEEEFENKETLFTLIEDSALKFSYWLRNNGFKARAFFSS